MNILSLSEFASKVRAKNRITFGDVQRLQRNVLPHGIESREDVELLISLDRDIVRVERAWEKWLAAVVVDFVVWAERPTGVVDQDTARWLIGTLKGADARLTKTARFIAREIVQEAQAFENEALVELGAAFTKSSRTPSTTAQDPISLAA